MATSDQPRDGWMAVLPYPITDGVTAYEKHLELHQRSVAVHRPETMTYAG